MPSRESTKQLRFSVQRFFAEKFGPEIGDPKADLLRAEALADGTFPSEVPCRDLLRP